MGGNGKAEQLLRLQAQSKKVSHDEWVRSKDHERVLRQKLIMEAKRDLLETLVLKQEEEAIRMQDRSHQMFDWENKKRMHTHHKKLVAIQKEQKEILVKKQNQDISYLKFKDWLKRSLIK